MAVFVVGALALGAGIISLVAETRVRRGALTAVVAQACVGQAAWTPSHTLAIVQVHAIFAARASVPLVIVIAHEAVADVQALAWGPSDGILAFATGKRHLAASAVRTRSAGHSPCRALGGFDTASAIRVAVEAVLAAQTRNFARRSIFYEAAKAGLDTTAALDSRFPFIEIVDFSALTVNLCFAFAVDQKSVATAHGTGKAVFRINITAPNFHGRFLG